MNTVFYTLAVLLSVLFLFIALQKVSPPSFGEATLSLDPANAMHAYDPTPKALTDTDTADSNAHPAANREGNMARTDPKEVLQRLVSAGATLYGAGWCGYTTKQLEALGITEDNTHGLDYVSCDTDEEACRSKDINAYPTWQINGQIYPGYHSPEGLVDFLDTSP